MAISTITSSGSVYAREHDDLSNSIGISAVRNTVEEINTHDSRGCWKVVRAAFIRAWQWVKSHVFCCCTSQVQEEESIELDDIIVRVQNEELASYSVIWLDGKILDLTAKIRDLKEKRDTSTRLIQQLERELFSRCRNGNRIARLKESRNDILVQLEDYSTRLEDIKKLKLLVITNRTQ